MFPRFFPGARPFLNQAKVRLGYEVAAAGQVGAEAYLRTRSSYYAIWKGSAHPKAKAPIKGWAYEDMKKELIYVKSSTGATYYMPSELLGSTASLMKDGPETASVGITAVTLCSLYIRAGLMNASDTDMASVIWSMS